MFRWNPPIRAILLWGREAQLVYLMRGCALGSRLIFSVVLFFCARLSALEPTLKLTQYAHASWTRQGGQLTGAVFALAQTRDGTLWVGTDYGLVRFDGIRFLQWTPPLGPRLANELISALAASRDGTLWIGTRFGLSHSHGTGIDQYQARNGDQVLGVTAIVEDHDGKIWVGANGYRAGGVCRVETGRLHCYGPADGLPNAGVHSLIEDHAGNLWVGGAAGLYRWRPGALQVYSLHRPPKEIRSIAASEHDEIWVATGSQGGLEHLVNGELIAAPILNHPGQTLQPREVLSDRDGGLWVGTWGQGLIHIYQGRIDRLTHAEGLSGDTVHRLFEDREGNIWVATDSGLDRFRDFEVTTISKRDGLSQDTVDSVCASKDGSIWIGSADGLNRIQDGKIVVYGKRDGLPSGNIRSIFEDKSGRVWVNSSAGLARFEQGRFTRLDSPTARKIRIVTAAAEGSDHCVWFSDAEQGLVRFCGADAADVLPSSQFGNKQAWALEADVSDGGLWLGFSQGGIAYYKPGQAIRQYTAADRLAAGAVRDLHLASGGTLWIATEGGLSRLSKNHIATLTAAKGLPCDRIHAIVSDETGALWLNTACGLVRITASDLAKWSANPQDKIKARLYDASDGMRVRPLPTGYFRRAARSTDGRLWFPVFDGVAVVDPKNLRENRLPPPVQIEAIAADRTAFALNSALRLPPLTKEVQIDYTALSFVAPEKVRFKYRLEGFDSEWADAGARRQALFTNLSPRQYRFHVIACNNDGVWNEAGASLAFSVAPALYQTTWFRFLCLAAFGGLLWSIYLLRVRHIAAQLTMRYEERLSERTRISRELHDTLLQNISGFALHLDALSKNVVAPVSAKDRLRDLRQQAEQWLREARESVWNLRVSPALDRDLPVALREVGERTVADQAIRFRVIVTGTRRPTPVAVESQLVRIVEEAMRNAIRHAKPTKITVGVAYLDKKRIRVEIRDDGCGFVLDQASYKTEHFGLSSMRERAQQIGAEFRITTSPGHGTRIEIVAPIKSKLQ